MSDAALVSAGPSGPTTLPADLPFRLGPFEVLEKLGEGGMGQVYRARDPHLQREVALKVMGPRVARARFLREARLAASLRDDHIVTVYQAGEADR
jgi:serine/threonine protein kinase